MEQIFYGYCEDPNSPDAAYEPPRDAPCPYCGGAIHEGDVRTHSVMWSAPSYAKRSYFYRTHRTCDEKHKESFLYKGGMDGFILDMIARNGD